MLRDALLASVLLLSVTGRAAVIDDFRSVDDWIAAPSDGVELRIGTDAGPGGPSMRLDFDFHGGAGYAIARKPLSMKLPDDYEFTFMIRGDTPPNTLEFKLLDASGENVWWLNQRNLTFPHDWTRMRIKKRHLEFAWGPSGGKPLTEISAIEIVITASSGGKGTVWIDDLSFAARAPRPIVWPVPKVSASSSAPGSRTASIVDGDPSTSWRSRDNGVQWINIDFGSPREFGGLTLRWIDGRHATDYDVDLSDDARRWETVARVRGSTGGIDPLFLRDSDARYVRLRLLGGGGESYSLSDITIEPIEFSSSRNAFFSRVAASSRRGLYPKYLSNVQSYWTVVGDVNSERELLINEEGMIELDRSSFSIEPFVMIDGKLMTWSDVDRSQSLADGYLPIPTVEWNAQGVRLSTTLFSHDGVGYVHYRLLNTTTRSRDATLFVALRPLQVNPPWQFLNVPGGTSPIHDITMDGNVATAEGQRVVAITPPDGFGATTFASGDISESLVRDTLPTQQTVRDDFGAASAAFRWDVTLSAMGQRDIFVALPPQASNARTVTPAEAESLLAETRSEWTSRLNTFTLELPVGEGAKVAQVVKSNLAFILINQDGPAIQPGSRSYDRSWIRDGSLTSAALLRLGHFDEVRAFIDWFAPYQFPSGKVPCCVDSRGADPVPEHDSSGELIYLIAEDYRQTHDRALLERHWPHVESAVRWMESLIAERSTPEYQTPEKRAFYGLVPESISHEGYSAKPMHSYWDDFFTLRGLEDASFIAEVLGKTGESSRYKQMAKTFRTNLLASIAASQKTHGIDYIPGSVELGDFDATSTTIALTPGGELAYLDRHSVDATFERYYSESMKRRDTSTWDAYTPYETRAIGSFVRLGSRERAHDLLAFFLQHLRPLAWNQWAEVVYRDPSTPKFIGDMPHTWVGSDFIRSVLDMFAYEDDGGVLVIGAGVPEEWMVGSGVVLRGLRTHYGTLDLSMRRNAGGLTIELGGTARPPGGVILRAPGASERRVDSIPATIVLK